MSANRCPYCDQPIRVQATVYRRCSKCKKQIGLHHKWVFRRNGRVRHRCCVHPDSYCRPPRHMRMVRNTWGGTEYRLGVGKE